MKKKSLRKVSIVGLVLSIGVIFAGSWSSQQSKVKAMPDDNSAAEKNIASIEKSTEKASQSTNNTPKVGVFENTEESVSLNGSIKMFYRTVWINTSEIVSKSSEEIIKDIEDKFNFRVDYPMSSTFRVTDISALKEDSLGLVTINVEVNISNILTYKPKINILVVPNGIFKNDEEIHWKNLTSKSTEGAIKNKINDSQLGFPERGVTPKNYEIGRPITYWEALPTDIGFNVIDKNGTGYIMQQGLLVGQDGKGLGRANVIPLYNDDTLYPRAYTTNVSGIESKHSDLSLAGIGSPGIGSSGGIGFSNLDMQYGYDWSKNTMQENRMFIDKKYFLRSENGEQLKEILLDTKSQVFYVYDLTMSKNLNFLISFSMYNISSVPKKFALLENTNLDYLREDVPIYSLANNEGFYLQPDKDHRLTIKLKRNGEWLSDYQKYKVAPRYPSYDIPLFGFDALGTGNEIEEHDNLDIPLISGENSIFQIGTPAKMIAPGEAIVGAYEVFVGEEISYMGLDITTQNSYDVYNNYPMRTLSNGYRLTQIPAMPTGPSKGNIHINYPNGEETLVPFVADAAKEAVGKFDIELDKLPNDNVGTINKNSISVLGVIEGDADNNYDSLPSNDAFVTVNVYNFGGTGQLQHVLQNSTWTKGAKELIVNPVALPDHTISYEYEQGKVPDTSKLGLQWVRIRMTDNMDKTQSKVIQVPVLVEKDPLSKGLWLSANDIYLAQNDANGMTSAQIKQLILAKSEAYGVDLSTKLSEGVTLDVISTDLTDQSVEGNPIFTATLQASKEGYTSVTKDIKIYLVSAPMINDPMIYAEKKEIKLGESNKFISMFQDISGSATKLLDVQYKSAVFPEYITPNKESVAVKIDGVNLPIHSSGIDFTKDRRLTIMIPEIPASGLVEVSYDVNTSITVRPPTYPITVEQSYALTGKRADGLAFTEVGTELPASFKIDKSISTLQIKYLMEGTNTSIPNNYPATMSGNIDDESDLINIDLDNYVLSKVQYDGVDQPIPTKAFKVKYGAVETITFYYKGVLKIKSAPNTIDFGSKKVSARSEEYDDSTYDQPLVIWDNRLSLTEWKVTLKQSDDMKLSGEAEQRLAGALRYKMADEEKILSKDSQEVFRSAHQTSGEYDVSKTWGPNKQGLRLKVPVGMVKQTGTYETTLTWRIEETY